MPFTSGICKSIKITSGWSWAARDGLLARGRLADDPKLGDRLEQRDHAFPVERVVFGDEDA
jgi:hypothetical protein